MFYVKCDDALSEVIDLYSNFQIEIPSFATPSFARSTLVKMQDVTIERKNGEYLIFNPRTATWCYVDEKELSVVQSLSQPKTLSDLSDLPLSSLMLKKIVTHLYRLGLLEIDGKPGLAQSVYEKGPLFYKNYIIEFILTEKCNLACQYCFSGSSSDRADMPLEIGYDAIDKVLELPTDSLLLKFDGGEPLLRSDNFVKLVNYVVNRVRGMGREVAVGIQLTTNGTLVDNDIAQYLKENQILVNVSLDGPEILNDKSRIFPNGKSTYRAIIAGIEKLREYEVDFNLLAVVNKHNCEEPEEILKHFTELGVESVRFNLVYRIGRASTRWEDIGASSEEYFRFLKFALDYLGNTRAFCELTLSAMMRNLFTRTRDFRCLRSPCGAGFDHIAIDAKGDIYPCGAYRLNTQETIMGNIREVEALETAFLKNPIVEEMSNRIVGSIDECKKCFFRHLCEGGCTLSAYVRHGNLYSPSALCEFYRNMYSYLLEYVRQNSDAVNFWVPEALICRF